MLTGDLSQNTLQVCSPCFINILLLRIIIDPSKQNCKISWSHRYECDQSGAPRDHWKSDLSPRKHRNREASIKCSFWTSLAVCMPHLHSPAHLALRSLSPSRMDSHTFSPMLTLAPLCLSLLLSSRSPAHSPCAHVCPHSCTYAPLYPHLCSRMNTCCYPCPHSHPEPAPALLHSLFYLLPSGLASVVECIVKHYI
jgi:hypothetical protein